MTREEAEALIGDLDLAYLRYTAAVEGVIASGPKVVPGQVDEVRKLQAEYSAAKRRIVDALMGVVKNDVRTDEKPG